MQKNHEEWLPIFDEKGKITGKATRRECHQGSKLLHPVVHVMNHNHEIFPQKRLMKKNGAHFKKRGIFLALKGPHIPAQGNALGNTFQ